jgi:hypothetical protein
MTPVKRTEIVASLEQSREDFLGVTSGVPESLAGVRPQPDRWSVIECVEHIIIVEERFRGRLEHAPEAPPADRDKEAMLAARVVDRSTRAQAPEPVQPVGRFTTLEEALAEFQAVRSRTVQFAEDHADDIYSFAATHPYFGPLNGVEALTILAAHSRRHGAQIREVRAALEQQ